MIPTEQELWDQAHQTANEALSLCVLGFIKPEQGRAHLARLQAIAAKLSGTIASLEARAKEKAE